MMLLRVKYWRKGCMQDELIRNIIIMIALGNKVGILT